MSIKLPLEHFTAQSLVVEASNALTWNYIFLCIFVNEMSLSDHVPDHEAASRLAHTSGWPTPMLAGGRVSGDLSHLLQWR